MRILVVDSNRWYARRVKEAIEKLAPTVSVDLASNVYEAQSRLDNPGTYQVILADLRLSMQQERMAQILDTSSAVKILWSAVESVSDWGNACKIQKPTNLSQMRQVVEQKVLLLAKTAV